MGTNNPIVLALSSKDGWPDTSNAWELSSVGRPDWLKYKYSWLAGQYSA